MRTFLTALAFASSVLAAGVAQAGVIVSNVDSTRGDLQVLTLQSGDDLTNNGPFSTNGRPTNVAYLFDEGVDRQGDLSFLLHFDRSGGPLSIGRVAGSFDFELTGDTILGDVITGPLGLALTDNLTNGVSYQRCPSCFAPATVFRGLEPSQAPVFGDVLSIVEHPTQALIYTVTYDFTNDGSTMDEARFTFSTATDPTPEPAAWALMIAGFGLTGAALRRRSRAQTVA